MTTGGEHKMRAASSSKSGQKWKYLRFDKFIEENDVREEDRVLCFDKEPP